MASGGEVYVSEDGSNWPTREQFTYQTQDGATLEYEVPCLGLDGKLTDSYTERYLYFKVAGAPGAHRRVQGFCC